MGRQKHWMGKINESVKQWMGKINGWAKVLGG